LRVTGCTRGSQLGLVADVSDGGIQAFESNGGARSGLGTVGKRNTPWLRSAALHHVRGKVIVIPAQCTIGYGWSSATAVRDDLLHTTHFLAALEANGLRITTSNLGTMSNTSGGKHFNDVTINPALGIWVERSWETNSTERVCDFTDDGIECVGVIILTNRLDDTVRSSFLKQLCGLDDASGRIGNAGIRPNA
jgi:hypothetical protein